MSQCLSTCATEFDLPTLRSAERFAIGRPAGSADSLLLAKLAKRERQQGHLTVVVCADALDVYRLSEELQYFEPALAVRAFPDWETLPYDILSPHPDLVSERIETLYRLMTRKPAAEAPAGKPGADGPGPDLLVISARTAMPPPTPASLLAARTFPIRQ